MKTSLYVKIGGACLLVFLIVAVVFYNRRKTTIVKDPIVSGDPYLLELEQDKKVLSIKSSDTKFSEPLLYRAMIRLSEINWPEAQKRALAEANSTSPFLRAGAAQALGRYSGDEVDEALKKLIADPDPQVKSAVLKSLGFSNEGKRKELLEQTKASLQKDSPDYLAFLEGEYKHAKNESDKGERQLKQILEMAEMPDSKKTGLSAQASLKLVELAPYWESTVFHIRSKVEKKSDPAVMAVGIRFLAGRQDTWLKSRWAQLAKDDNAVVRKAVVQSLHRTCPPERGPVLLAMATSEKDPTVQDLIAEEADLLSEDWATKVYSKLEVSKDTYVQEKLKKIRENHAEKQRPPCLESKKEVNSQ